MPLNKDTNQPSRWYVAQSAGGAVEYTDYYSAER